VFGTLLFLVFLSAVGVQNAIRFVRYFTDDENDRLDDAGVEDYVDVVLTCLIALFSLLVVVLLGIIFPFRKDLVNLFDVESEAQRSLAAAVDNFPESIALLCPETYKILNGNINSADIFGSDFTGRDLKDKIHKDDFDRFVEAIKAVGSRRSGVETVQFRLMNERAKPTNMENTRYFWVESTFRRTEAEYGVIMLSRNIEKRKESSRRKWSQAANHQAEMIHLSKLRYISSTAHDLKTPIQSLSFALDLLTHTEISAEQYDLLQQALVSVDLMTLIVSQTMDIATALAGKQLKPRKQKVKISEVLERVKIIISGYAKQVPIVYDVHPRVSDDIYTDGDWLWQMLLTYLTNACKFTTEGKIHLKIERAHVDMDSSDRGGPTMLYCEVADTGTGVDADKIDSIFKAFANNQSHPLAAGTGLGLYGLQHRVTGLGGTCGVKNNVGGEGSIFWFRIPYATEECGEGQSCFESDNSYDDLSHSTGRKDEPSTESDRRNLLIPNDSKDAKDDSPLLKTSKTVSTLSPKEGTTRLLGVEEDREASAKSEAQIHTDTAKECICHETDQKPHECVHGANEMQPGGPGLPGGHVGIAHQDSSPYHGPSADYFIREESERVSVSRVQSEWEVKLGNEIISNLDSKRLIHPSMGKFETRELQAKSALELTATDHPMKLVNMNSGTSLEGSVKGMHMASSSSKVKLKPISDRGTSGKWSPRRCSNAQVRCTSYCCVIVYEFLQ
jgi:signal transduction histidine kinase